MAFDKEKREINTHTVKIFECEKTLSNCKTAMDQLDNNYYALKAQYEAIEQSYDNGADRQQCLNALKEIKNKLMELNDKKKNLEEQITNLESTILTEKNKLQAINCSLVQYVEYTITRLDSIKKVEKIMPKLEAINASAEKSKLKENLIEAEKIIYSVTKYLEGNNDSGDTEKPNQKVLVKSGRSR